MKKSIISIITALMLCVSLLSPAAVTTLHAQEITDTEVTETEVTEAEVTEAEPAEMEKTSRDADNAVLGYEYELQHWNEDLQKSKSWTHEFTLEHTSMVYFDITSTESLKAKFDMTLIEKESGKPLLDSSDYVNSAKDYFNSIALNPGTYVLTFTNTSDYYMYYNFKLTYCRFHTVDDPLFVLSEDKLTIYKGKSSKLNVEAYPEPSTYNSITWSSGNTTVATVDQNGKITAKAKGTATITADVDGQILTCKVTVKEPTYSSLNYKAITLYAKQTKQLKLNVTPSSYGLDGLSWKSSNPSVAAVSSKGLVTAKAKGTATITATVNGVKRTCTVTVKPMQLNKSSATVYVKKTLQLKVNGGTGSATWKSSNTKVATVTSKGVVKGVKPGTATITATKNGKKITCKVTVKWAPETGVVTTNTYKVNVGNYKSDSKYFTFKGKTTITITAKNTSPDLDIFDNDYLYVVFETDDTGREYYHEFIDPGDTCKKTFTVPAGKYRFYYDADNGCNITLKRTVKPQLSKTSMKVGRGYTNTLSTVGVKNGGTWSSSNKSIATVTSKGVVKGKKNGTCYIKYTLKTGKVLKCKVTVVSPVTCSTAYVSDTSIYNECGIKFTNYTNKKITYIKLNIKQYDNKGSRIYDGPYDWYYVNDTLPANSSETWEFWVSDDAKRCSAYITKVYFADGSTWTP